MRSGLFRTYGNRPGPAGIKSADGAALPGREPQRAKAPVSEDTDICVFLEEFARTSEMAGLPAMRSKEDRSHLLHRGQRPVVSPLLHRGAGTVRNTPRPSGLRAG